MNYCTRGHHFPDVNLTCPTCASERGDEAMRSLQIEFLRKVLQGDLNYTLRVAKGSDRHVLMYTSYTKTFCGQDLKSKPHIAYEPYSAEALAHVCSGCRAAITSAVQEAVGR